MANPVIFTNRQLLLAALNDVGHLTAPIKKVGVGQWIAKVPRDSLLRLQQRYIIQAVQQAVSRCPGHKVRSITKVNGKLRIKISVHDAE